MFVSAGSISNAATSPWSSARSSASRSLNGTTRVVSAGSTCGPIAPGRLTTRPASDRGSPGLVDRAVVAPVHHRDLRPAGEMPGEPQHEPVGIGGRHGHLPLGQPETACQFAAHPRRVLRRAASWSARSTPDGRPRRRGPPAVTGHRTGVAEAEVDVLDAVHVEEAGSRRRGDVDREAARPPRHPRHRHAGDEVARDRRRPAPPNADADRRTAAARRPAVRRGAAGRSLLRPSHRWPCR